jgi:TonB family protein
MIHGMTKLVRFLSHALFTSCFIAPAYSQVAAPEISMHVSGLRVGVDLLSDTGGTNMSPYMKNLISDLKKQWLPLVKDAVDSQSAKPRETILSLTIAPDGQVLAMKLEKASTDTALDKAAWNAAKETSFLPLPSGLKDTDLKLRFHFVVD